jgi:predicted aspartyl protease
VGEAEVELADGTVATFPLAYIVIVICEKPVLTLASVTDSTQLPLLGFDVMELLGLQIDVRNRKLLKPIKLFTIKRFILKLLPGASRDRLY